MSNNKVIPFTLKNAEIKGRIVRLDEPINFILSQHEYPEVISQILGELIVVSSLIGSQFKDDITLTMQLQFKDNLQYIVTDYQSPGYVRGYAKFDSLEGLSYKSIIKNSLIIVTIDRPNANRYQGIVEINKDTISGAIEEYFYQSEQIETALKLSIAKVFSDNDKYKWCASGILIQKLPTKDDEDCWDEAKLFFSTIKDHELLNLNTNLENFLYSVYNEMQVTVYEPIEIVHRCRCSKKRMEDVLESLGFDEVVSMLVDDKITIDCQFCGNYTEFNCDDINKIFKKDTHILREDNE